MSITTAVAAGAGAVPLPNAILDVYSQEILFAAQPLLRFEQVVSIKEELGVLPGLTIKFMKYSSLTGSPVLAENVDIVADALSSSQIPITVGERGKAVGVSELLLRASFDDVLASAAMLLGMHFAKQRDAEIRDVLYGLPGALYAKGRAGRAALIGTDTFDVDLIRDAVAQLATNKAPKFNGDAYLCFLHPAQAKALRRDSAWINASNYGAPDQIFLGEIGRIEDVRFIETTQIRKILSTDGSIYTDNEDTGVDAGVFSANADVYSALIVGDHVAGLAIALEAEMRDNGVMDFGRKHEVGYYGIWGSALIESGHGLVLESA